MLLGLLKLILSVVVRWSWPLNGLINF